MIVRLTERFLESYKDAPPAVQKAVTKQLRFLEANLKHPSLHAKKYDESQDLWQARITRDWRLYFFIDGDIYRIYDMEQHPK